MLRQAMMLLFGQHLPELYSATISRFSMPVYRSLRRVRSGRCVGTLPWFLWVRRRLYGNWGGCPGRATSQPLTRLVLYISFVFHAFAARLDVFLHPPPPRAARPPNTTAVCSSFSCAFVVRFFISSFVRALAQPSLKP